MIELAILRIFTWAGIKSFEANRGDLQMVAIAAPESRWWAVALHGEVVGNEEKYGCLKREIIGECL